jgi:hypothetical protein
MYCPALFCLWCVDPLHRTSAVLAVHMLALLFIVFKGARGHRGQGTQSVLLLRHGGCCRCTPPAGVSLWCGVSTRFGM